MTRETYRVEVCGLVRELPLFEVAPGTRIAVFNLLGDTEATRATGHALAERLAPLAPEIVVTTETKSIPLAYEVAARLAVPYVVLRKERKPYMGDALAAETRSITAVRPQTLFLDEKDRTLVAGRRVAIVDDVISTGSTLAAMRSLMERAGAVVIGEAAVFTEGDPGAWPRVIALGHLPVFTDSVAYVRDEM